MDKDYQELNKECELIFSKMKKKKCFGEVQQFWKKNEKKFDEFYWEWARDQESILFKFVKDYSSILLRYMLTSSEYDGDVRKDIESLYVSFLQNIDFGGKYIIDSYRLISNYNTLEQLKHDEVYLIENILKAKEGGVLDATISELCRTYINKALITGIYDSPQESRLWGYLDDSGKKYFDDDGVGYEENGGEDDLSSSIKDKLKIFRDLTKDTGYEPSSTNFDDFDNDVEFDDETGGVSEEESEGEEGFDDEFDDEFDVEEDGGENEENETQEQQNGTETSDENGNNDKFGLIDEDDGVFTEGYDEESEIQEGQAETDTELVSGKEAENDGDSLEDSWTQLSENTGKTEENTEAEDDDEKLKEIKIVVISSDTQMKSVRNAYSQKWLDEKTKLNGWPVTINFKRDVVMLDGRKEAPKTSIKTVAKYDLIIIGQNDHLLKDMPSEYLGGGKKDGGIKKCLQDVYNIGEGRVYYPQQNKRPDLSVERLRRILVDFMHRKYNLNIVL